MHFIIKNYDKDKTCIEVVFFTLSFFLTFKIIYD